MQPARASLQTVSVNESEILLSRTVVLKWLSHPIDQKEINCRTIRPPPNLADQINQKLKLKKLYLVLTRASVSLSCPLQKFIQDQRLEIPQRLSSRIFWSSMNENHLTRAKKNRKSWPKIKSWKSRSMLRPAHPRAIKTWSRFKKWRRSASWTGFQQTGIVTSASSNSRPNPDKASRP